jgi:hypothetical protein
MVQSAGSLAAALLRQVIIHRSMARLLWLVALLHSVSAAVLSRAAAADKRRDAPLRVRLPNTVRHAIASAGAGAVGVTLTAPIEIVRINVMNNKGMTLRTAASTLRGGMMFRGNTADAIQSASRTGIILPAFALYKVAMRSLAQRMDPTLADDGALPRWALFGAGALAGATSTLILFPLEVARTRMAMECVVGQSTIGCLLSVCNTEGVRAVYRGLTASMCGVMPFNAMKLTSYDTFRSLAIEAQRRQEDVGSMADHLPPTVNWAIGAMSGVVAATACFPLEVIRRRKMIGDFAGLGVLQAMGALVASDGVGALYRGVYINAAKVSVGTGATFCLYELFKDCLSVDGRRPPWQKDGATRLD